MRSARFALVCLALTLAVPRIPAIAAGLPTSPAAALDLAPTAEKIGADCRVAIPALVAKLDAIVALPRERRTFDTVSLAINNAYAQANDVLAGDLFMGDVGPEK